MLYTLLFVKKRMHANKCVDVSLFISSVISVGGDGMFSEVMNGLLRYDGHKHSVLQSKRGKDIMLGIIPAGEFFTRFKKPLKTF